MACGCFVRFPNLTLCVLLSHSLTHSFIHLFTHSQHQSFQPRDIVVAKVISLGDASAYLLTTAENELGVIVAYDSSSSSSSIPMMPISWCEVLCPTTGVKELRKVAKPQPQYLTVRE